MIEIHRIFLFKDWINRLCLGGLEIYFLSDHGALSKIKVLELIGCGMPINCLSETGELKPHKKISNLLLDKYKLNPLKHLHLGDR